MNTKLFSKLASASIVVVMFALSAFAVPTTYAQGTNPPSTPTKPAKPGEADKYGEKILERIKTNLAEMKTHLAKANEVMTKAQETIAAAKAKGTDTTKAEAALATFKSEVAKAQASYEAAQKLFDTHPGFANGAVTDREVAKQTVTDLTKNLREAQQTLSKASRDFQKAAKDIRGEHKDKPKPGK